MSDKEAPQTLDLSKLVPSEGQTVDEYKLQIEKLKKSIPEGKASGKSYPRYVSTLTKAADVVANVWENFQLDNDVVLGKKAPDKDGAEAAISAIAGVVSVLGDSIQSQPMQVSLEKQKVEKTIQIVTDQLKNEESIASTIFNNSVLSSASKKQIEEAVKILENRNNQKPDFPDMPEEQYKTAKTQIELIKDAMTVVKEAFDNMPTDHGTRKPKTSFVKAYNPFNQQAESFVGSQHGQKR